MFRDDVTFFLIFVLITIVFFVFILLYLFFCIVGLEAAAEYERMNDIRLYMSVLRILYENEFKTRSSITISGARIFDVGAV